MTLVLKTRPGSTEDVEIAGVGLLGADAKGGVPIDQAARSMSELMDASQATVTHPRGVPLEGEVLAAAAEMYAAEHELEIVDLTDDQVAGLPAEIGALGEFQSALSVGESEARGWADQPGDVAGDDTTGDVVPAEPPADASGASTASPAAGATPAPGAPQGFGGPASPAASPTSAPAGAATTEGSE